MKYVLISLALAATVSAQATAKELTDAECASIIVQETREAYYRTRGPCACPEDRARDGSRCGGREHGELGKALDVVDGLRYDGSNLR